LCSCLKCHNKPDLEAPGEQFDDEDNDTDDSGEAAAQMKNFSFL